MKLEIKIKYALEAMKEREDLINPVHQNVYGEGFLEGFSKAMEMAKRTIRQTDRGAIKDETKTTKVIRRKRSSS